MLLTASKCNITLGATLFTSHSHYAVTLHYHYIVVVSIYCIVAIATCTLLNVVCRYMLPRGPWGNHPTVYVGLNLNCNITGKYYDIEFYQYCPAPVHLWQFIDTVKLNAGIKSAVSMEVKSLFTWLCQGRIKGIKKMKTFSAWSKWTPSLPSSWSTGTAWNLSKPLL